MLRQLSSWLQQLNGSVDGAWLLPLVTSSVVGGAVLGVLVTVCWNSRRRRAAVPPVNVTKKMKIYHKRTFRSARVAWLVAELGRSSDFEFVQYDPYTAADDERQWYRGNIHPHGTVPALVDEDAGKVLVESSAICMYLAERYGQLLPPPDMAADYYDWCVYAAATVDRSLSTIETQIKLKVDEQKPDVLGRAFASATVFAQRLEAHLNKHNFICGTKFSTADVVVGYCVMWASVLKGGRIISNSENVKNYLVRLKARPTFTDAMGTARDWINSVY